MDAIAKNPASSRGLYYGSGNGPALSVIDIGHDDYMGVVDPDSAFWSLIKKERLAYALTEGEFLGQFLEKRDSFLEEMHTLRFGLEPSAVYFNPTERCDLNCVYCYIPEDYRRNGEHMSADRLLEALGRLKEHFTKTLGERIKPQIVFHGSEPLLNKDAMFAGVAAYENDFRFGVQTNGTQLDDEAIEFLTSRNVGIGLSLDAADAAVADRTRKTFGGQSAFGKTAAALEKLKGYPNYNVICTVTRENMDRLVDIVNYFHGMEVPGCMLNPVRLTLPGSRAFKPADHEIAAHYLRALDRSHELYRRTGRKLVVVNFANALLSILAPLARRLMCDISPCGGGRCFFAVSARGDMYPCSEFISLDAYRGGNLFTDDIAAALKSEAFGKVTGRKVEDIDPCNRCSIRHYCGSPCPAEAAEMNGGMDKPGGFCELYEEQVRYALRLIADGKENDYLWDNWDQDTQTTIDIITI